MWDQLSFDANWLSSVERAEAEAALDRFATWQAARPEMELLGTEVRFRVLVDLGSDRVQLTGSADRVERDPQGRIRIVDFKTSRAAPQSADVAVQDQMGVYQLAVLAGAFDELAGPGARPAGAELVYLRLPDAPSGRRLLPKSFHQASLDDVPYPTDDPDDGPDPSDLPTDLDLQPTWVHRRLAVAAHLVRRERFVARTRPRLSVLPVRGQLPGPTRGTAGRVDEGASTCPSRTGRAPSSAHPRSCPRPWPSRSPTSSWRRSRHRWSPG